MSEPPKHDVAGLSVATVLEAPERPTPAARVRSSALDAVRVVAVLAVVAGHTYVTPWVGTAFFTWHVPVFFVLSGYLWSPGRKVRSEVRKRVRTLLVPYLCWLVLVTACWVWYVYHRGGHAHPEFFANLAKGGSAIVRPYSAYWFITAMFVATVLARMIERVTGRWAIGAIGAIGVAGVVFGTRHPEDLSSVWWASGLAVPCLTFLAAGMVLRDLRTRIEQPLLVGLIALLIGWRLVEGGSLSLNIKYSGFGTPVQSVVVGILIPIGMILIAEGIFVGRFREVRWISTLAQSMMPVILSHALVIAVLVGRGLPTFTIFVLATTIPWCFGLIALRVRALRALLL